MGSEQKEQDLFDKVIHVNRVTKVVKGGRRFSFTVIVAVGDKNGKLGIGVGKAHEVPEAIRKATERAKKRLFLYQVQEGTLPHIVTGHFGASQVLLKPAAEGTGIIAGGTVRAMLEVLGVRNILTKCVGRTNPHNLVKATIQGLKQLQSAQSVEQKRGRETDGQKTK